jgi:hypothetical protein
MVITTLRGGLGNQMFQYAAGRALADRLQVMLKLDITKFNRDWLRAYGLFPFSITCDLASKSELAEAHGQNSTWRVLKETPGILLEDIINASGNVLLDGYWQSSRYFSDREQLIRKEFTLKEPLSDIDRAVEESILRSNAVALHVRRGDYISVRATARQHDLCGPRYFSNSVNYIAQRVDNLHLFVFSDDNEWPQSNLKFDFPTTYITHNYSHRHTSLESLKLYRFILRYRKHRDIDRSYNDMHLMSLCKHFVISNSSFGWWGAWLGKLPTKIVCAPMQWHVSRTELTPTQALTEREFYRNLIPTDWVGVEGRGAELDEL